MAKLSAIETSLGRIQPWARIVKQLIGCGSLASVIIGPALAGLVNIYKPGLVAHAHVALALEAASLAMAFWILVGGIALYTAASGIPLVFSTPKQYRAKAAAFEPGRKALFISLLISGFGLIASAVVLGTHGVPMSGWAGGVLFVSWMGLNTAIATTAFITTRKTFRGSGLFLFCALYSAVSYAGALCSIVIIVNSLWATHQMIFPQYPVTPFAVGILLMLFMTMSAFDVSQRRIGGVIFGTIATVGTFAAVDPSGFLAILVKLSALG